MWELREEVELMLMRLRVMLISRDGRVAVIVIAN